MSNFLAEDLDHILDHTRDLWEELRGQRIFITGGTGFFGCWLLESFAWANDRLGLGASALVLTRDSDAFARRVPHIATHAAIRCHAGDVRTFAFPAGEFSHVIQAATEASSKQNDEDPLLMLDTIIQGTRRVLDFAVASRAKKFLLTSSGAVYGRQPAELTHIPETYMGGPDTTDSRSAYAEGKRVGELLCSIYHRRYGLETKIARCFAFVGPRLPLTSHFAVGNFIEDALQGGPTRVCGDGTPFRSYLYSADLTAWLWTILMKGASCRPYNVGSEESISISDLAVSVSKVLNCAAAPQVAKSADPNSRAERYVPATRRAADELGLKSAVPLEDGIRRTADWYRRAGISERPLEIQLPSEGCGDAVHSSEGQLHPAESGTH